MTLVAEKTRGTIVDGAAVGLAVAEMAEVVVHGRADRQTYGTRIEDFEDDRVTIAAPMHRGDLVPLIHDTKIDLRVMRADAMFSASATILSTRTKPYAAVDLHLTSEWKRQQRRSGVRLETVIEPELVEAVLPGGERRSLPLVIHNLSVGGVLLVSGRCGPDQAAEKKLGVKPSLINDHVRAIKLRVRFRLSTEAILGLEARIVRFEEIGEGRNRFWRLGTMFIDVTRRQEDTIFRYIFAQQRERRRKGVE